MQKFDINWRNDPFGILEQLILHEVYFYRIISGFQIVQFGKFLAIQNVDFRCVWLMWTDFVAKVWGFFCCSVTTPKHFLIINVWKIKRTKCIFLEYYIGKNTKYCFPNPEYRTDQGCFMFEVLTLSTKRSCYQECVTVN